MQNLEQFLGNQLIIPAEHHRSALSVLITDLAACSIEIAALVRKGALADILGEAGSDNVQGEPQKKLDVLANDLLISRMQQSGVLAGMASEEEEKYYEITGANADYLLLFDPLDGSSNIDINVSIGTIFSVLQRLSPRSGSLNDNDFLQSGNKQLLVGYAIYGPSTQLVFSTGTGVHAFTLNPDDGQFYLTSAQMTIAPAASEYAINGSRRDFWQAPMQRYINELQLGFKGPRKKAFNTRWIASMVADVHRVLTRGGVFLYPLDSQNQAQGGKLRLMYEANPMAMLVEQAGGTASTGITDIMTMQPERLHQRVSVMLGAADELEVLKTYHQEAQQETANG